jgi:Zn-dependent protease
MTAMLIMLFVLYLAVVVHEFAHGWCAYKLGDPTAKYAGRLTLNPLAHIDPFGTIIMPVMLLILSGGQFVFGYAKPVPINFRNLGNRKNIALVGLSGPLSNFVLAFIGSLMLKSLTAGSILGATLQLFIVINLVLGVFNLIPLPPLDGSRILIGLLPQSLIHIFIPLERYGFLILAVLVFGLGLFDTVILPIVKTLANLLGVAF